MIRVGPTPVQCLLALRWVMSGRLIWAMSERINEAMWRLEAKAAGWTGERE